jgi:hypothetical protein
MATKKESRGSEFCVCLTTAAAQRGMTRSQLYQLAMANQIEHVEIGGYLLFKPIPAKNRSSKDGR